MYFSFSRLCEDCGTESTAACRRRCAGRTPARRRRRSSAGRRAVGRLAACGDEQLLVRGLGVTGRVAGNIAPSGSAKPGGAGGGRGLRPDGARRVGHLGTTRGGVDVDDDGQVDRETEVTAQRVADRPAQDPLDGVLGELARGGEQRGAVDQAERAGQAEERALLRRQGGAGARPRCRTGPRSPGSTRRPARRVGRPRPHPLRRSAADGRDGRRVLDRVGAATIPRPVHTCVQTVRGRARRRRRGARRLPCGLKIPPDRTVRGHANRHRPPLTSRRGPQDAGG